MFGSRPTDDSLKWEATLDAIQRIVGETRPVDGLKWEASLDDDLGQGLLTMVRELDTPPDAAIGSEHIAAAVGAAATHPVAVTRTRRTRIRGFWARRMAVVSSVASDRKSVV